jgi:hypothetical protein
MSFLDGLKSVGSALGWWHSRLLPVGCSLGRTIYGEAKRAAQVANVLRPRRPLRADTEAMLRALFPQLDVSRIRVRTHCRLPPNRFRTSGTIYAMTFGYTIYYRDSLNESDPGDLVNLIHEVVHVDQVRRYGGERGFACEYGKGYLEGGGDLPAHIRHPTAYHRNPLEAEAYTFEARFQDEDGKAIPDRIPWVGRDPAG